MDAAGPHRALLFHAGTLLSSTPERDAVDRGRTLARALAQYNVYVSRCLDWNLLGPEARAEASRDPHEVTWLRSSPTAPTRAV